MPVESPDDLADFFDLDDFADECTITGPNNFSKTINVILNTGTEQIAPLGAINVESPNPAFVAMESDLEGVKKGMTATIRSRPYTIERIAADNIDVSTVYLSE